ncbi:unnamed protein product [Durusdinium trenchii]
MRLGLQWILLLELPRQSLGVESDSSDWARQILSAQRGAKLPTAQVQSGSRLARIHARRSALAAEDAERAAKEAVSLSQQAALWLRPDHSGDAWIRRGRDDLTANLATVAVESKDAAAAHRALASARRAKEAVVRARAVAAAASQVFRDDGVPQAETTPKSEAAIIKVSATTTSKAAATSSVQTPAEKKEEDMYKGERMAAQTAGLCVLSICIALVWFQSNMVDISHRRGKNEDDEVSILDRCGVLCCCCRRVGCCARCCVQLFKLLGSCSCSTITLMGLLVFLLGYGFKHLWDQHLIQPHLEEATIYLFFATIAFVIILLLVGSFVMWLREKVGFLHSGVSFVHDKMDVFMEFLGFDSSDEDDSDQSIWSDPHAYNQRNRPRLAPKRTRAENPAKEAHRGHARASRGSFLWGTIFGKAKKKLQRPRDVREMPV